MKLFDFDTERNWEYENGFYLTAGSERISKILAHYELYKMIIGLPGQVAEFGVFKGASLVRFAAFRDSLESPHSRKIIGFDAFGHFPEQKIEEDQKFAKKHDKNAGTGIPKAELEKVLEHKKHFNVELVGGDINATLPKYIEAHPELRLALMHVDVDVYQPTKVILEALYDRVVPGGLMVFDDYSHIHGETRAVDEFFAGKGATIEKLSISHTPSFVRKKRS